MEVLDCSVKTVRGLVESEYPCERSARLFEDDQHQLLTGQHEHIDKKYCYYATTESQSLRSCPRLSSSLPLSLISLPLASNIRLTSASEDVSDPKLSSLACLMSFLWSLMTRSTQKTATGPDGVSDATQCAKAPSTEQRTHRERRKE